MILNTNDKFFNSDDAIFHYTKKETVIEKILPNRKLRFGCFSGTNDPQEYRPKTTSAGGFELDERGYKALALVHFLVQKHARFLSFCRNSSTDSGLLRSRMWAQYGDNQHGACLVLSKREFSKSIENIDKDHEAFFESDVTYEDPDRKHAPSLSVHPSDHANSFDIALRYVIEHRDKLFFLKQKDFRDECEFRAVYLNKAQTHPDVVDVDIGNSLKGIVFGDRFPSQYGPTIEQMLDEIELEPQKLLWHKNKYHLVPLLSP